MSWDNPAKGLRVIYKKGDVPISVVQLENIGLQLQRASGDEFNYVSSSAVTSIREDYTMITGKRRHCTNEGNQQVLHFENGQNVSLDLELRVYDDGIAFRYVFPQPTKEICVTDENTAFVFQEGITRWTQKLNQAYEDFYLKIKDVCRDILQDNGDSRHCLKWQILFLPLFQKRMWRKVTVDHG